MKRMRWYHLAPCFDIHIPARRDIPTCGITRITSQIHSYHLSDADQVEPLDSADAS